MRVLAVETSCDETAIAIAEFFGPEKKPGIRILSNIIASQVKLHAKFGGVVPNLAKREHQRNVVPILLAALKEARLRNSKFQIPNSKQISNSKIQKIEKILTREPELLQKFKKHLLLLKPPPIDVLAVTYGPGLAPALWVGVNFTKALAHLWRKPLITVNHMAGHLYSSFLQKRANLQPTTYNLQPVKFPALALLVSGGHTQLVLMRGHGKFKVIGETLDDAAGEAFDKVARILGLGYPGGPEISREAGESSKKLEAGSLKLALPRPMINSKDYNFSFSGLKTAVLYLVRDLSPKYPLRKIRPCIAKEFQDAVVEVLIKKTIRAAKEYKVKTVLLGGGVAANRELCRRLTEAVAGELLNTQCLTVLPELAVDNALMMTVATYFVGKKKAPARVGADANARLS